MQVTCEYSFKRGAAVPIRVHTVVVSTQHMADVPLDVVRHEVMEHVIKYTIPPKYLDERTVYHINPCGEFITGGPMVNFSDLRFKVSAYNKLYLLIMCSYIEENFHGL